jgi:2-keto-4-pentenoate hydratase
MICIENVVFLYAFPGIRGRNDRYFSIGARFRYFKRPPMNHDNEDQIRKIANAIARYLDRHPDASDTLTGVATWWLGSRDSALPINAIEDALALLVTEGVVVSRSLHDGQMRYARGSGSETDKVQARGMAAQLAEWRTRVLAANQRLGWKIGFNDEASQARMGLRAPAMGYLHRGALLESGGCFAAPPGAEIKVEMEIALRIGCDVAADATLDESEAAIAAIAPAFEVVDVTQRLDGIEALLRGNLYHAAVMIGPESPRIPNDPRREISGRLQSQRGLAREVEERRLPAHFGEFVQVVAATLGRHGERLCAGDWIICGSIIEPVAVQPGDHLKGEIASLAPIKLSIR